MIRKLAIPHLALLAAFGLAACAGGDDGERETRRIDLGLQDSRRAAENAAAAATGAPEGDELADEGAGVDAEPATGAEDPAEASAAEPPDAETAGEAPQ